MSSDPTVTEPVNRCANTDKHKDKDKHEHEHEHEHTPAQSRRLLSARANAYPIVPYVLTLLWLLSAAAAVFYQRAAAAVPPLSRQTHKRVPAAPQLCSASHGPWRPPTSDGANHGYRLLPPRPTNSPQTAGSERGLADVAVRSFHAITPPGAIAPSGPYATA
ncbi:hypothetical protein GSI_01714 [Ganoderma sinense ZZ0214-1]|uniref:Uncharacterized protein n=1 Tax=Ganoderma sinense ZZ0214-1 TaxID=1077348 RepID=A0A2G8SQL1_9APHY|nr:hypothetical protein GSI_01714 [Ganoderma sinense ZZ0214-1]